MSDIVVPGRVTVDLVWQRLIAILEDQAQTLIRTAFSNTTREAGDLSAGLFDRRGRMVAQAVTGTPGHVNSMALAVEHFLRLFPLDSLEPGDVLVSNDPWICSGHLHDFTIVSPIFHRGRAVGAVANTVHVVDIGGLGFGADASDVHEEGLCIPVCKLARAGIVDPLLMAVIRANVRESDQVVGDLHSSIAGNAVAIRRTMALLEEFGLADLEGVSDAIIDRTRDTVEARIMALPDGIYRNSLALDGTGDGLVLPVTITIAGSRMTLDFAGSPDVSRRGVNVVLNYTTAYAVFGVNCLINPDIPCNHGSLAPIEVRAPEGSILNARRPAAVSARHMIGQMLPDLVLGALGALLPVPAEGAGLIWNPSLRGRGPDGRHFATVTFNAGGAGAQSDRDGWNATAFPSGVRTMPVEAVEASAPILVRRKELLPDSGGPGRQRGGLGQVIEIEGIGETPLLLNAMFDRIDHPPRGREGGMDGRAGRVRLASGRPVGGKGRFDIPPGDRLILELPGGGGFGPPEARSPEAIARDLRDGYVSAEAAERLYRTRS
ncbi:hydantoinase B/oxoprolinase family protein [Sandaracinobacteroides saxicola]|uniref:Hydantoinase B/oxoprolinase family protein n=1 Tax=Sandaracinobacteroides saxicola TaxID=2759707 RepID=A0A7G5IMD4_9SPHN|nr:hydantoinase B/oxoprolinase family protein [Sandaracinobacteroides saxicola]QMW24526.1 hydantoinase B/oxoprolinase family protein [Sandaracinobacteroides saxicola]